MSPDFAIEQIPVFGCLKTPQTLQKRGNHGRAHGPPQVEGSVQEKAGLIIAVQACELLGPKKESSQGQFLLSQWRTATRFGIAYL